MHDVDLEITTHAKKQECAPGNSILEKYPLRRTIFDLYFGSL